MLQTLNYILIHHDLLIFLSAVWLTTLSALLRAVPEQSRERLHLKLLAPGLFFFGFSRFFLAFAQISKNQQLCLLKEIFVFSGLIFLVEFVRQNIRAHTTVSLHILVHFPIWLVWLLSIQFSVNTTFLSTTSNLMTLVTSLVILFAAKKLTLPGRIYSSICALFLLALSIFKVYHELSGKAASLNFCAVQTPITYFLESVILLIICLMIVAGRVSSEKRLRYDKILLNTAYSPLLFFITIILVSTLSIKIHTFMDHNSKKQTQANLDNTIEALSQYIHQQTQFANTSVKIIADVPIMAQYLEKPDEKNLHRLNLFLEAFASSYPDGICYLIDQTGIVRASSSMQSLFVGNDLSMRDYFKSSMNGRPANLIDFGLFTQQLGYYSSAPVRSISDGQVIGVCAVKRNLDELGNYLKLYHPAMIINEENRIFLSSDSKQTGKLVRPPEANESKNIETDESVVSFSEKEFAHVTRPVSINNWKILAMESIVHGRKNSIWLYTTVIVIIFMLTTLFHGNLLASESKRGFAMAQEQFKAIFYNAPESILIISCRTLEILEANTSTLRQFNIDNANGMNFTDLIPQGNFCIRNTTHNISEKIFKHEREFVKPCGQIFTAEVTGSQIQFNQGNALIIMLHDISYHKNIESRLMSAKMAAEETNRMKIRFFANASHEIRTPLTAIIGLTELARSHCTSDEQRKILELVKKSEVSMISMVNDILDLTKLESGQISLKNRDFNLEKLVSEIIQLVTAKRKSEKIELKYEFIDNCAQFICADPDRIRQIILNLLDNAVKFTSEGMIKVCFSMRNSDNQLLLQIEVSDTGSGIPDDIQEVMFEPFLSSDPMRRTSGSGAGLGLSITRQIVEAMKGAITYTTSDKGTCFKVCLPIKKQSGRQEKSGISSSIVPTRLGKDGGPLKFLVADDNDVNLFLARSIIEKYGGECDCAMDGLEAIEMLEKNTYDVLLLDVQMPRLDGIETIRMIRHRNNPFSNIPIISISAFASEDEIQKAKDAGTDFYLTKPYFPDDLLLIIRKALHLEEPSSPEPGTNIEETQTIKEADHAESSFILTQINLNELKARILNKPENIIQISEIFNRRSSILLSDLDECVSVKNCEKLRETVHSIKGLTGMLAAEKPHKLSRNIELLCKDGNFAAASDLLPELKSLMNEVARDIKTLTDYFQTKLL